jgi:hypothetical protein
VTPPISLSATAPPIDQQPLPALETAPLPQMLPPGGTYRYDGGPANPVPVPRATPAPPDSGPISADGRPVSLKAKPAYTYPAYGETLKVAPKPVKPTNTYVIKANTVRL